MNKKAVSPELLVTLIVIILAAITLFAFSGELTSLLKEDADIETCRLSVLAQAQTKILGKSIVPLDCPRRTIKIYENKVEVNGKKSSKYSFKKLTENEVNRILAEELRLCWYKLIEGKRDVFESSFIIGADNTCLICSEIEFDDKLEGQIFSGLLGYLKSKEIPKGDLTYHDYLIRSQRELYLLWGNVPWTQYTPWSYGTTNKVVEDKFNAQEKYTIYFLAFKPNWGEEFTKMFTSAYYIGLGKEYKFTDECTILMN